MKIRTTLYCLCLLLGSPALASDLSTPVASDSRIKTFVYSENDVFDVVTHFGYESNIEFGTQEEIETISVGDRMSFQIVPNGRRLFIRPLVTNARTNMTVVTSKHAYQFDLTALPTPTGNEELAYVVRFYYPDDKRSGLPALGAYGAPAVAAEPAMSQAPLATAGGYNYNYTFNGSDAVSPLKLFDDGKSTYFKLRPSSSTPVIASVSADGRETSLSPRRSGEYWVVDTLAAKFAVRQNGDVVYVYNEKWSHGG
jgi:type IV secretion system protein VirB9